MRVAVRAATGLDCLTMSQLRELRIRGVEPEEQRHVRVRWDNGSEDVIDLTPILSTHGKRSAVWLNDRAFQSVGVGPDGASLHWTDGSSLSVLWVHEMRAGQMSNEEFRRAMTLLDASLRRMAGLLGKSRRLIASYRKDQPVPRYVALAVRSLLERHDNETD